MTRAQLELMEKIARKPFPGEGYPGKGLMIGTLAGAAGGLLGTRKSSLVKKLLVPWATTMGGAVAGAATGTQLQQRALKKSGYKFPGKVSDSEMKVFNKAYNAAHAKTSGINVLRRHREAVSMLSPKHQRIAMKIMPE